MLVEVDLQTPNLMFEEKYITTNSDAPLSHEDVIFPSPSLPSGALTILN
jgi:hypothetical protein